MQNTLSGVQEKSVFIGPVGDLMVLSNIFLSSLSFVKYFFPEIRNKQAFPFICIKKVLIVRLSLLRKTILIPEY